MIQRDIAHNGANFTVMLDDEDTDILVKPWWISFKTKGKLYCSVRRKLRKHEIVEGKPKSVKLHNEVWEKHFGPVPAGCEIDHFNYNTCDNRKENLRLLSKQENNQRTRKKREKHEETTTIVVTLFATA